MLERHQSRSPTRREQARLSRQRRWLLIALLVGLVPVVGACGGACESENNSPEERPGAPDPPTQFDPELEPAETPEDFDPFSE